MALDTVEFLDHPGTELVFVDDGSGDRSLERLRQAQREHPSAIKIVKLTRNFGSMAAIQAVGATAVVPGIGTVASLGLSSFAVVGYLEATALYAQAIAELHGVHTEDPEKTRTMVMALMLGEDGRQVMNQILASGTKGRGMMSSWGLMMGKDDSKTFDVSRIIRNMFVKRFLLKQTGAVFGRALPFGVGAVVGGGANLAMSKQVIAATHEAFGPRPTTVPAELGLEERAPRFGDRRGRRGEQAGPVATAHGEITGEG